jgi:hypothetical protein
VRKSIILPLLAMAALAVPGATAFAGDDPPVTPVPPAFVPPTPAPVTDVNSAGAFAKIYVARNASTFLGQDRRKVIVTDVNAACLQSPILDTRFGCVFTIKALVISRNHGWDRNNAQIARKSGGKDHGKDRHRNRHFRVRQFGCLGFLRIDGGPSVTPTATVVNVECARVPRGDEDVVAPSDN